MEQNQSFLDIIIEIFNSLFNLFDFLGSTLLNGLNFFISTLATIPMFLLDLFNELPSFYKIGISGLFGLLMLVVFLKLVALVK